MTLLFKNGGPYAIAISQYGSTLADLPIKFGNHFAMHPVETAVAAGLGGLILWGLVEYFTKKSPVKITRSIPFIGKFLYKKM